MNRFINWSIIILLSLFFFSSTGIQAQNQKSKTPFGQAQKAPNPGSQQTDKDQDGPEWLAKAVIYEVNIRQYTNEGTFEAFAKHLPRLQRMGVNIIWLMPKYYKSK